jgi:hypothetical protein
MLEVTPRGTNFLHVQWLLSCVRNTMASWTEAHQLAQRNFPLSAHCDGLRMVTLHHIFPVHLQAEPTGAASVVVPFFTCFDETGISSMNSELLVTPVSLDGTLIFEVKVNDTPPDVGRLRAITVRAMRISLVVLEVSDNLPPSLVRSKCSAALDTPEHWLVRACAWQFAPDLESLLNADCASGVFAGYGGAHVSK